MEPIPKHFFVYIVASKPRGVLYAGMTSDLSGRAWQHRERLVDGFAKRYWAGRLVWFEAHDDFDSAMKREKLIKCWRREWKIKLIEDANPTWRDLFADALKLDGLEP